MFSKFFFSHMRLSFFWGLLVLPIAIALFFFYLKQTELKELENRFASAMRKEGIALEKKERKERFVERYSHSNPYFLDQEIESISFLQKEKKRLESLLNHPAFPESQAIRERLQWINENRLKFAEENIRATSVVKEIEEKQKYGVQIDEADLQKILSLVEDRPVGSYLPPVNSPQLLITDFKLRKIETPFQTEVFEMEMALLKREFIK